MRSNSADLRNSRLRDREITVDMKRRLRRSAGRNCTALIWFLIAATILKYGVYFVLELLPIGESHIKYIYNPVMYILVYILLFPIAIKIANRKRPEAVGMILRKPPEKRFATFRWVIIGIGITQILQYLVKGIFLILEIVTGLNLLDVNTTVQPEMVNRITTIIVLGFIAPFLEEVLYRGTILKNTVRYGEWFGIISTGAVCGLIFVQIDQAANAVVLGIVCGFLMVKAKSVRPAIMVHMGYSLIRLLGLCFSGWGSNKKGDLIYKAQIPEWVISGEKAVTVISVLMIALGIIFLVIEKARDRDLFELEDAMPGLTTGQKVAAYLTAPQTMIFMILSVVLMLINVASGILGFR